MKKTINVKIKNFSIKAKLKNSRNQLKNKNKNDGKMVCCGIVRAAFKQVLQATKNALTIPQLPTKVN